MFPITRRLNMVGLIFLSPGFFSNIIFNRQHIFFTPFRIVPGPLSRANTKLNKYQTGKNTNKK